MRDENRDMREKTEGQARGETDARDEGQEGHEGEGRMREK